MYRHACASPTQLSVYNLLPDGLSMAARPAAGRQALPRGRAVAVLEPFLKVMADGTLGVRVDNPAEVRTANEGRWVGDWGHAGFALLGRK